jgi:aerobic carbon-monoxide dehydrogenase medium subunit
VKPASFEYHCPRSVDEAVELLIRHGDEARLMAGGQSLNPMLNLRVARPGHVVDISRIASLRGIHVSEDRLWIGAAVTHGRLEDEVLPGVAGLVLRAVASGIAYRSVRNRGTIGGSVAHADPAADWPPVLCALGATVHVASANGRRAIPMQDFMRGVFETALEPGELLEAFEIPFLPADVRWGFSKQVLNHGGFAAAIAVCIASGMSDRGLWLGACGTQPFDATAALDHADRGGAKDVRQTVSASVSSLLDDGEQHSEMDRYRRHLHAANAALAVEQATAS